MERFSKKHPTDYEYPYTDMLRDIDSAIKRFEDIRKHMPNYVLLNTTDYEHLAQAYHNAGVLPRTAELVIIQSARVIRTEDMEPGTFDITGN